MRYILMLLISSFAFTSNYSQAQEAQASVPRQSKKLDRLQVELELTADQVEQLRGNWKTQGDREEKKAMLLSILTEEQKVKYLELKEKPHHKGRGHHSRKHHGHHKSKKHGRFHRADHDMDEETKSKLIEMRTSLEPAISEEDRASLAELRAIRRTARAQKTFDSDMWNIMTEEEKKTYKRNWKENVNQWKQQHIVLQKLKDKYREDVKVLFESNKEFFEIKWAEVKKMRGAEQAKMKLKAPEDREHCKVMGNKYDMFSKGHKHTYGRRYEAFLLMDADIPVELTAEVHDRASNSLSIAPNPASQQTTLSYEIRTEGNITLQVRDELGRIIKDLGQKFLNVGSYTKILDTSELSSQLYFVTLWDDKELISQKLIIQQ